MELIPVNEHLEENHRFVAHPGCQDTIYMCVDFYKKIGFNPPWICYYAAGGDELVGSAAFKGMPVDGKVEIAYGTLPAHRQKGIGAAICRTLTQLALSTQPHITTSARTLPEENYFTQILRSNGYVLQGTVKDPEDGDVWEWVYAG